LRQYYFNREENKENQVITTNQINNVLHRVYPYLTLKGLKQVFVIGSGWTNVYTTDLGQVYDMIDAEEWNGHKISSVQFKLVDSQGFEKYPDYTIEELKKVPVSLSPEPTPEPTPVKWEDEKHGINGASWGEVVEMLRKDRRDIINALTKEARNGGDRETVYTFAGQWQFVAANNEQGRLGNNDPWFFDAPPTKKEIMELVSEIIAEFGDINFDIGTNDHAYFYCNAREKLEGIDPECVEEYTDTIIYRNRPNQRGN
jgi:hypothetical protein